MMMGQAAGVTPSIMLYHYEVHYEVCSGRTVSALLQQRMVRRRQLGKCRSCEESVHEQPHTTAVFELQLPRTHW